MPYKYIVSKNSFFNLLSSVDGMLDSLGRFSSSSPFSHRYSISAIRRHPKSNIESWLKETYIPSIADWIIELDKNPFIEPTTPQVLLTKVDINTSIEPWQAIKADQFISEHLKLGLVHLIPEPELRSRFDYTNGLAAWKIADQLMFMSDHWRLNQPAWLITLKTPRNESHILSIQMKFGIVNIHFNYPINGTFTKIDSTTLPEIPKFH